MTKNHVTISLKPEYMTWIHKKVDDGDYGSISHGVNQLIRDAIRREEKKEDER